MEQAEELAKLQEENATLKKNIQEYQSLQEDLIASRVFEKARKRLVTYMTFGGIVILLLSVYGINTVIDYAKSQAEVAVTTVTKAQIMNMLEQEAKEQIAVCVESYTAQIAKMVEQETGKFITTARWQTERLQSANKPIAASAQFEKTVLETEKTLDYTGWMNPVRDSGNEGSCVGFSVADALEYQILKTLDQRVVISPRFIYYYARLKGGFPTDEDTGANISDAVSTLSEIGAVAESDWPYVDGEFSTKPPAHLAQAVHYKISKKQSLANSADIKAALIRFGPVVGGIPLYSSANTVDKSGRIPMPGPEDTLMGYTSVSFVGFDDDQGLLKFKNHWKTDWGDNGYGYVSYEFADQFLKDGWAISMEQTE